MPPSVSFSWASKPAETKTKSGPNASAAGRSFRSNASMYVAVVGTGRQRDVDRVVDALPPPGLGLRAGARIERVLMHAEVQHARVVVEGGLRAVAVMNVPVDNQDLRQIVLLLGVLGADRHIVEDAKAHRPVRHRMVARRTHGTEGVFDLALHHGVDRGQHAAGGHHRGLVGPRRDRDIVAVEDSRRLRHRLCGPARCSSAAWTVWSHLSDAGWGVRAASSPSR